MVIEIGSVWISKTKNPSVLLVSDVSESKVETYWQSRPKDKFEWFKGEFLSKYKPKTDMVNHPPHYKDASGIECIEVTRYMGFCGGNCFKYIYRAGKKGSTVEDLEKAIFYSDEARDLQEAINSKIIVKIEMIAMHRDGLIFQSMMAVRDGAWSVVSEFLKDEVARLNVLGVNNGR